MVQNLSRIANPAAAVPDVPHTPAHPVSGTCVDAQFMGMMDAYRLTRGLARAQEVFTMYQSCHGSNVVTLAGWIVNRDVISFDWESKIWVPLFQFNRSDMTILPSLSAVLSLLNPILVPWDLAMWFAQPHVRWCGRTPSEALSLDPKGVLDAARRVACISI